MNQEQWKAEYSKWRAVIRNVPEWTSHNDKMWGLIHTVNFNAMCEGSHPSIKYAITGKHAIFESYNSLAIDQSYLMRCNLSMSKEACETHRLKQRGNV